MAAGPRLSEAARHVVQPDGIVATRWPRVRDTCTNLGWGFDNWQDGAGRLILAVKESGKYAANTVVMSIPRQAGKTYLIGAIVFALCLIIPGLTVIWTAHRLRTSNETFRAMKVMAAKLRVKPHILHISNVNGDQGIHFVNGSRILFGARENGFGLGFANVGVLILDECQRLTDTAMDDLIPTLNTAANPLIVMTGTPPRPKDPGEVFIRLRTEAIDGESDSTLYIEFSADRGADPNDLEQVAKANPSFPHRTPIDAINRMRKILSDDSFQREALGIHDEIVADKPIVTKARWKQLRASGPPDRVAPNAFGLDMSHGRQISIVACWINANVAHVEEVWAGGTPHQAYAWLKQNAGVSIPVVVDAISPASSMVRGMKSRFIRVKVTSANDMARACGDLGDRLDDDAILFTHNGEADGKDPLSLAVANGRKREIRDAGGWGWDRSDPSKPIHPAVAMTLAAYGAAERYRQPEDEDNEEAVY